MKILLVGEYSRLHNSLQEGLQALGHEVDLVSSGDGFKNYPTNLSYRAKYADSLLGKTFEKITGYSADALERGLRFKTILPQLKGYDIVQLMNQAPIQTFSRWEMDFHQKLHKQNAKLFLLSSGTDSYTVNYWSSKKLPYSPMSPYFEKAEARPEFDYMLNYQSDAHRKVCQSLEKRVNGIIATDLDYVKPLEGNPLYRGLIPNPVNTDKIVFEPLNLDGKIVIFLGINRQNQWAKGIPYFEEALDRIAQKFSDQVEIIKAENLPYSEYMQSYSRCHILLDQVYSQDQGYNALEAMARGKVVFTGAGDYFAQTYPAYKNAALDATPNVDDIYIKLSDLLENKEKIKEISTLAAGFIQEVHNHKKVAQRYLEIWHKY